ncbi:HAD family acid phosphatase [Terriglobus roseus]|uniref:HAD superfamily, subfamily IIIB (Acid phosphatase) n=1 Tax=Terriglobus roseus TaxID=392734 RepID=A0A1H4U247_9BACT|nr:HAD family acid phosphatase [Terriglobus roseus]SEC62816.1 HAD superfamily, subfamily IIIB (Acid phosphatase) [Terriglobus roseus]
MRRSLTGVLTLAMIWSSVAHAQAAGHPPTCPNLRRAPTHPTASQMLAVQEQAAADPTVILAPEPLGNIGVLRYALRDYADCTGDAGCYWTDLDAQTKRALNALEDGVKASPRGAKLALVLDIDETSLSSYCEAVAEDFGYIPDRWEKWIVSNEAVIPIAGTVRLAKRAQELGVSVFFITGRPEAQRAATEANLTAAGYAGWKHLSLKQPGIVYASTGAYKAAERARIKADGYTLLLNMGDQWNDLQGEPMALHSVKLPNPFYYLP